MSLLFCIEFLFLCTSSADEALQLIVADLGSQIGSCNVNIAPVRRQLSLTVVVDSAEVYDRYYSLLKFEVQVG